MDGPQPWHERLMLSFLIAGMSHAVSGGQFNGPWNSLLNVVFPPDGPLEVVPQIRHITADENADFNITFHICAKATPAFVLMIKSPDDLLCLSKRQEADLQLRRSFADIGPNVKIPVLHGVLAFGTKIAFYEYDTRSGHLKQGRITPDSDSLPDTAPKVWWRYNITEQEGANKFREIVDRVKGMCEASLT